MDFGNKLCLILALVLLLSFSVSAKNVEEDYKVVDRGENWDFKVSNGNKGLLEVATYQTNYNNSGVFEEINTSFYDCTPPTGNVKKYCANEYGHYIDVKQNGYVVHKLNANSKKNKTLKLGSIGNTNVLYTDFEIKYGGLEHKYGNFKQIIYKSEEAVKETIIFPKKTLASSKSISYTMFGEENFIWVNPIICDAVYYDCNHPMCDYPVLENCINLEYSMTSNTLDLVVPTEWYNDKARSPNLAVDPSILYNFNNVSWDGYIHKTLQGSPIYTRDGTAQSVATGKYINLAYTICLNLRASIDFKIHDLPDTPLYVYDARLDLGHAPQVGMEKEVHIKSTKPESSYPSGVPLSIQNHYDDMGSGTVYAKDNITQGYNNINISSMGGLINDSLKGAYNNQFSTAVFNKNDSSNGFSCLVNSDPLSIISSETQSIPIFNNFRPRLYVSVDLLCEPPADGSHFYLNTTCYYEHRSVDLTGNVTMYSEAQMHFYNSSLNISKIPFRMYGEAGIQKLIFEENSTIITDI